MTTGIARWLPVLTFAFALPLATHAQAPAEFVKRAQERFSVAVARLDADQDGVLMREEAQGDLLLVANFDRIDANRDGRITREELERFLRNLPSSAL